MAASIGRSAPSALIHRTRSSGSSITSLFPSSRAACGLPARRVAAAAAATAGDADFAASAPASSLLSNPASSAGNRSKVTTHVAAVEAVTVSDDAAVVTVLPATGRRFPLPDLADSSLPHLLEASLPGLMTPQLPLVSPSSLESLAAQQSAVQPVTVAGGSFESEFEMGELLGRGTFGEVRAATERSTGRRWAVKVVKKVVDGVNKRSSILEEVAFCRSMQSCSIVVRLHEHGVYEDPTHLYIVQELCSGGDVASLQTVAGGRLDEREAASVMLSVLRFLAHMHSGHVCYGDVKPNNFVLRRLYPSIDHMLDPSAPKGPINMCAVDFGCCQATEPDVCLPNLPISGTPAYLSPEAFSDCFGVASDVWAAGVMLFHLLSGGFPFWVGSADQFHGMTSSELRDGIVRGTPMFLRDPWAGYSPRVKDLICKMLEKDPKQRITASAACAHLWFAEVLGSDAA